MRYIPGIDARIMEIFYKLNDENRRLLLAVARTAARLDPAGSAFAPR